MKASPKKGSLSTYFYKNQGPHRLRDTMTVFLAFPASPTMYGSGEKIRDFFEFSLYFFESDIDNFRANFGSLFDEKSSIFSDIWCEKI